jgi:hypothetical protein
MRAPVTQRVRAGRPRKNFSLRKSCSLGIAAVAVLLGPMSAVHAAPSTVDDRIALSANGESLTGTSGGAGASIGWIHNFDADTLLGVAAEYQALSVSHWAFASLSGAITRGTGNQRYTLYGEAHEGAGDDGPNPFKYRIEALGVTGTYFHRLSATLEDKQVNVETTHGNLPKVQFAYLWNPHLQTTISYAYSFGGNLGTRLTSARIDVYGHQVSFLAGAAVGQASPSLLGTVLGSNLTLAPHQLREGYVGVVKAFPSLRSDLTFVVDYQRLSGGQGTVITLGNIQVIPVSVSQRWTGTLNYTFHIGHHGT